jgi:hypothetical protein
MEILRTPEERSAGLPGYPFEPRYATIEGGGHVLQEECGPERARVVGFIASTE